MAGTSSSKMTEAEIDKLTVAKLKALLDEKEIAHEKKELKAALAAKLKDFLMKDEGKEEEEEKKTTKKRKASSNSEEEEEPLPVEKEEDKEEEEGKKRKKKVSIAKKKSKKEEEEKEEKKEFSDDDDSDDDKGNQEKDEKKDNSETLESLIADPSNPENCTMTVYIKGNEGRLIGKKGETLKYIEARFRASIKIDRESGTCAVKGPTSEMEECKKIIQEVCETGSIADRHPASSIQQGAVLKEHETLNGISAANVNAYSIEEESLPEELRGIPNDQEVAIEIPCPGKEGRVIGKGGATIRDIERVSGANLKVVKGSGICNVQGKRIDVIRARQVVLETMALETDTFGMQRMQNQQQQQQMMTPSQYAAMQMGGGAGGGVYGGYYGGAANVYGQQQGGAKEGGSNINPIIPEGQTRIIIPTQGHEGRIIGKGGAHVKLLRDRTGCDVQMDRSKQPVTCVITGTAANVKECERLVNEAIEKANQTFGPNGQRMYAAQQQQQQYGMAYGQQAAAAPVNVYGGAPQTAQVYGAAAVPQVYGAAVPQQQQPQQQQQLMQQYQQYYQQQQVYAAPQQQEYDPSQPQAVAAAAASDWATYYSEGKPYYYNSKTGETKWA
jgi:far upstream element-binding protein